MACHKVQDFWHFANTYATNSLLNVHKKAGKILFSR